ncbi:MAG: hypothetical protein EZS28_015402 [Streblomastix strix]|uniref:Uncharacterized protein n=1 Tax=Streblomastix strix TaxID=222440 RepID=A0A5J4W2Z6_9EUKA|nr:MAG: hypothetical protein EZS28_015402 [Streblomastix strix]
MDQINSYQLQTPKPKIQLNVIKDQFQHILQKTSQFEEFLDPDLVPSFRAIFCSEFEFADWNRQNDYKLSPSKFKTAKKRSNDPIVILTEELHPIVAELQGPLALDLAIINSEILMISTDTCLNQKMKLDQLPEKEQQLLKEWYKHQKRQKEQRDKYNKIKKVVKPGQAFFDKSPISCLSFVAFFGSILEVIKRVYTILSRVLTHTSQVMLHCFQPILERDEFVSMKKINWWSDGGSFKPFISHCTTLGLNMANQMLIPFLALIDGMLYASQSEKSGGVVMKFELESGKCTNKVKKSDVSIDYDDMSKEIIQMELDKLNIKD